MYSKEELIEFFKEDFFATKLLGAEILDVKDGYAKCVFNPNENHKNAKGVTMGGAIFTLADFTFAVATNQSEDFYTVSTTSNISFLNPGLGKTLYAEATKVRDGKTICFYDVIVYDENNKLVAKRSMCGTHIKRQ